LSSPHVGQQEERAPPVAQGLDDSPACGLFPWTIQAAREGIGLEEETAASAAAGRRSEAGESTPHVLTWNEAQRTLWFLGQGPSTHAGEVHSTCLAPGTLH